MVHPVRTPAIVIMLDFISGCTGKFLCENLQWVFRDRHFPAYKLGKLRGLFHINLNFARLVLVVTNKPLQIFFLSNGNSPFLVRIGRGNIEIASPLKLFLL